MFQNTRTLFEHFLTNKIFTKFRLESSESLSLIIEPFMDILIFQGEMVFFKILLHLPLLVLGAKIVPDRVFPPSPISILKAILYANVPIFFCVSEQSGEPTDDHMI